MSTPNQFIAAVEGKSAALLELALIQRVIYPIAADEDPEDFVAAEDGAQPLGLAYGGILFWLDPDDNTSVHDGTTVIVTSDGYRYLASDYVFPYRVLAVEEETPPGSPALGDSYHIGAAPTGAWSANAGDITTYTSRGWVFETPPVGRKFYNEDDGRFYFQDENGDFIQQTVAVATNTVTPESQISDKHFHIIENQTTNTPPALPAIGVKYIVGPSPTDAWSGHAGKIARSDDATNWTFETPAEGYHAYDKTLNALFKYDAGWINAAGAYTKRTAGADAASATITLDGGGSGDAGYALSSTAPTTTEDNTGLDTLTVSHTASAAGKGIEVHYKAIATFTAASHDSRTGLVVGVFLDSEVNARDWAALPMTTSSAASQTIQVNQMLTFAAPDASPHTYKIMLFQRITDASGTHTTTTAVSNRSLIVREAA